MRGALCSFACSRPENWHTEKTVQAKARQITPSSARNSNFRLGQATSSCFEECEKAKSDGASGDEKFEALQPIWKRAIDDKPRKC